PGGPERRQIRRVSDVRGPDALQSRPPAPLVVPVERRSSGPGCQPVGKAPGPQPLCDPAPRLAVAAHDQRRPRRLSHRSLLASVNARRGTSCRYASPPANFHVIIASMQWDDVRLFLALCRARTVGRAARTLGVDASTVSRRLVTLEETLGASLFDRGRDG